MKKALITYVRNEALILPLWLTHHLKSFAPEDIYILDNESIDDTVKLALDKGIPSENIKTIVSKKNHSCNWLTSTASDLQNELLSCYDWVLLAESDEFIVVDHVKCPGGWEELMTSLSSSSVVAIRALGYDVLHRYLTEPPLDVSLPILRQRITAMEWRPHLNRRKQLFSKPCFASVKIRWRAGAHDVLNIRDPVIDDRLILFHLNMCDINFTSTRRKARVGEGQVKIDGDRLGIGKALVAEINVYLRKQGICEIPEHLRDSF